VRGCTDPNERLRPDIRLVVSGFAGHQRSQHERSPLNEGLSSRANPSRDGDAKPGIFLREDRPVAGVRRRSTPRGGNVKSNLARFTAALSLLATLALTLGAGAKWF